MIIPDGIETIPDCAFSGCISITTVIIPYGVKKIGRSSFNHCENLSIIEIPNSITTIGEGAFRACNFEFFSFPDGNCNLDMFVLCACPNLKSVKFPDSIKEISAYCCKFCPNLTSIWIGNNVTKIQYEAFAACPKLKDVYCNARDVPDTKDEVPFRDSYIEYATLHVPANSIDKYKADPEFGKFGSIVAITDSEMNIVETKNSENTVEIYTLDGMKHNKYQRGLNILKMSDNKARKIYCK